MERGPVDANLIPGFDAQLLGDTVPNQRFVGGSGRRSVDLPPLLQQQLVGEAHAGHEDRPSLHFGRTEKFRREDADVGRILDRVDRGKIFEAQLPHVEGRRGHRDTAVRHGQIVCLGNDQDVGAKFIKRRGHLRPHRFI